MAQIIINLPDAAGALADKHSKELGYPSAADYAFELLRNFVTTREDALYTRMNTGEANPVFGQSQREQADAAQIAAAAAAEAVAQAQAPTA